MLVALPSGHEMHPKWVLQASAAALELGVLVLAIAMFNTFVFLLEACFFAEPCCPC